MTKNVKSSITRHHRTRVAEHPESRSPASSQPKQQRQRREHGGQILEQAGKPHLIAASGAASSSSQTLLGQDFTTVTRSTVCRHEFTKTRTRPPFPQRGLRTPGLEQETHGTAPNVTGTHESLTNLFPVSNSFTGLFSL